MHIDPFWMGQYAVTQVQWETIMGNNPSHFKKGANYPVEHISWNEAVAFIRRLAAMSDGRYALDLPTEASGTKTTQP